MVGWLQYVELDWLCLGFGWLCVELVLKKHLGWGMAPDLR